MTKLNDPKTDPYIPIECGLHSAYEVAIMHKNLLHLDWNDSDKMQHKDNVMPLDLKTIDHKEFLIAKASNNESHQIRLDKILHSNVTEVIKT